MPNVIFRNIYFSNIKKIREKSSLISADIKIILLFTLQSFLCVYLIGFWPLERLPEYDRYWLDAMQYSSLYNLRNSILDFNFEYFNWSKSFGVSRISEAQGYQSLINPINILFFFRIDVIPFIIIRYIISIFFLQYGMYKLILLYGAQKRYAIYAAAMSATLPVLWSNAWSHPANLSLGAVPWLLIFVKKYFKGQERKYIVGILITVIFGTMDLMSTIQLNIIFLGSIIVQLFAKSSPLKLKLLKHLIPCFLVQSHFFIPFLDYLNLKRNWSNPTALASSGEISFYSYWKFILNNGIESIIIPREGSAIIMYIPLSLLIIVLFGLRKSFQDKDLKLILILALAITILPSLAYLFPPLQRILISYLRVQFQIIPLLLYLLAVLIISRNYSLFKKYRVFSILSLIVLTLILCITLPRNSVSIILLSISSFSILSILSYLGSQTTNNRFLNKSTLFYLVTAISILTQLASQNLFVKELRSWQYVVKDVNILEDYKDRITRLISNYSLNEPEFNTAITSAPAKNLNSRLDVHQVNDLELASVYGIRTIFQYRELENPVTREWYDKLICPTCNNGLGYAVKPPPINLLMDNEQLFVSFGIKYIISDSLYEHKNLVLLEKFDSGEKSESRSTYLYKYVKDVSSFNFISSTHTSLETEQIGGFNCIKSIKSSFEKRCEKKPSGSLVPLHAVSKTNDGMEIYLDKETRKKGTLIVSVPSIWRWKVYVNNEPRPIEKLGNGMLKVEVNQESETVKIEYFPLMERVGIIITILTLFFYMFSISKKLGLFLNLCRDYFRRNTRDNNQELRDICYR